MGATGGFGVKVYMGTGPLSETPTYAEIAVLEDIGEVGGEAVMDEITAHDATGGFIQKLATGLMKIDDIELKLIHDALQATHANAAGGLMYNWLNRTLRAYKVVLPNGLTWEFDAYIAKWKIASVKDKAIRTTVTMTITGQPTIT